ncbi:hypothetical protein CANMA_005513 [Candida margitis]|uniref:uncharacterized protein n=1 Tax=Candida margitis TaxID=1775924 RepID=UPI0022273927|nr:uncharacterized protein CANMA_005513 [Candida margitis]KAI5949705.1 hypothetical protein CANMA_005513 [Candida margitis]
MVEASEIKLEPGDVDQSTEVASTHVLQDDVSRSESREVTTVPSINTTATPTPEYTCRWVECNDKEHANLTNLVNHVNTTHIGPPTNATTTTTTNTQPMSSINPKNICLWENCSRYGTEQPSRFSLISHCRTHTGEKPFFCPIPECEKHFTRSDALTKHVKGVHDLHNIKDQLSALKESTRRGKLDLGFNVENLSDEEYARIVDDDFELKMPWWFNNEFVQLLKQVDARKDKGFTIGDVENLPLDARQYWLNDIRIKQFLNSKQEEDAKLIEDNDANNDTINIAKKQYQSEHPDEIIPEINSNKILQFLSHDSKHLASKYITKDPVLDEVDNIDKITDVSQLKQIHDSLLNQLNTGLKINKIVSNQLEAKIKEKRQLWVRNQLLIDANLQIGLPPEASSAPQRVMQDRYDEELLRG